jgi:glycosyltransferase involved in cell wall biosynthesis
MDSNTGTNVGFSMSQWVIRHGLRLLMTLHSGVVAVLGVIGPRQRPPDLDGHRILLTGTFYADNWARAHLLPLANATQCARLCVVSTWPVPTTEKLEVVYPPQWLSRMVNPVSARLLTFFWLGLRMRPHIVGGFHLLLNGLLSVILARLVGARAMYFCVGGPAELLGGGVMSENRVFEKLRVPDPVLERQLLDTVSTFDLVITMGKRAIDFFRQHGVDTEFHVVSGGMDAKRFYGAEQPASIDLVLVARLVTIKRIDLFLAAVRLVCDTLPAAKAVIVGDGPLRATLQAKAEALGIAANVTFVGHQANVEAWLRQARIFVLTSQSEGLALSLMEAMFCGLPAIVPQVGDLSELVEDGVNGYLVADQTPQTFAKHICDLLTNDERYGKFSRAARAAAQRYESEAVTRRWDEVIASGHHASRAMVSSYSRR